jgi:hypothetical protein
VLLYFGRLANLTVTAVRAADHRYEPAAPSYDAVSFAGKILRKQPPDQTLAGCSQPRVPSPHRRRASPAHPRLINPAHPAGAARAAVVTVRAGKSAST